MSLKKKTIKAVDKVLNDPEKRKLYSEEELIYMEKQVKLLKEWRSNEKRHRKANKGFGYDDPFTTDDKS